MKNRSDKVEKCFCNANILLKLKHSKYSNHFCHKCNCLWGCWKRCPSHRSDSRMDNTVQAEENWCLFTTHSRHLERYQIFVNFLLFFLLLSWNEMSIRNRKRLLDISKRFWSAPFDMRLCWDWDCSFKKHHTRSL